jgi:hypothetical protein
MSRKLAWHPYPIVARLHGRPAARPAALRQIRAQQREPRAEQGEGERLHLSQYKAWVRRRLGDDSFDHSAIGQFANDVNRTNAGHVLKAPDRGRQYQSLKEWVRIEKRHVYSSAAFAARRRGFFSGIAAGASSTGGSAAGCVSRLR